jgi:hypothetical protein
VLRANYPRIERIHAERRRRRHRRDLAILRQHRRPVTQRRQLRLERLDLIEQAGNVSAGVGDELGLWLNALYAFS